MTRHLDYVIVEIGRCLHCGRDASDHSVEGLCSPHGRGAVDRDVPRQCFRGEPVFGFIDLAAPHDPGRPEQAA